MWNVWPPDFRAAAPFDQVCHAGPEAVVIHNTGTTIGARNARRGKRFRYRSTHLMRPFLVVDLVVKTISSARAFFCQAAAITFRPRLVALPTGSRDAVTRSISLHFRRADLLRMGLKTSASQFWSLTVANRGK